VGATPDGSFGSITFGLVKQVDPTTLIERYCARRMEFLESLKSFPVFGRGWSRRVAEVKEVALRMVQDTSPA
jgi:lysozyme family protein